ncbi:MAG: hypothetical protein AB7G08_32515 [Hyphomicrobiaceae bacterium]
MSADHPPEAKFDEKVSEQITRTSTMRWNLAQEVIITTEDKLRLCVQKHVSSLTEKGSWVAPVSLFFTFVTVVTTAEFRAFVLPAATWHAVFVIGTLLSGLWSIYALSRSYGVRADIDSLVRDIKQTAKPDGD